MILFEEVLLVFQAQDLNVDQYTRRLQQPFRMQSSATLSSMTRKEELLPRHHWIIFSTVLDRLESSKEPILCHQHQVLSQTAAWPSSFDNPSVLPSPTSSPSSRQ